MTADFPVVLDACVLIPAPLRDTLLRLAERPRLYLPRWSDTIIDETVRNLQNRIGLSEEKAAYLLEQMRKHFADAWVTGYESLIDRMGNHPKDRHVLAAVRSIVRRGPLRSFDLAHLMLTRIVFPAARLSGFKRENAA